MGLLIVIEFGLQIVKVDGQADLHVIKVTCKNFITSKHLSIET